MCLVSFRFDNEFPKNVDHIHTLLEVGVFVVTPQQETSSAASFGSPFSCIFRQAAGELWYFGGTSDALIFLLLAAFSSYIIDFGLSSCSIKLYLFCSQLPLNRAASLISALMTVFYLTYQSIKSSAALEVFKRRDLI